MVMVVTSTSKYVTHMQCRCETVKTATVIYGNLGVVFTLLSVVGTKTNINLKCMYSYSAWIGKGSVPMLYTLCHLHIKVIQMRVSCTNIRAVCCSLEAWVDIPNATKTRVSHRRLQHVP